MKLLVAIPHYFKSEGDTRYGSGRQPVEVRSRHLLRTLLQLHQFFGRGASQLDIANKKARFLDLNVSLEIIICVHENNHLLNHLQHYSSLFSAVQVDGNPKKLGFACHKVLGEREGYDRYLFLEDDLVIHDTEYFQKLDHVESTFGPWALVQPHRFERGHNALTRKCYIDGALRKKILLPFTDPSRPDNLVLDWGHSQVHFEKALNPHSGSFCLSHEQWLLWKNSPHFKDQDSSFIGPLESSASLSVMKSFEIYKTLAHQAHHFEIEHQGQGFLSQVINGALPLEEG
jgi:hypothetical protein